jgi:chromosome segregation ATPase
MGFAASQARYLMLVSRKSDLELQGQFFNQARIALANITGSLFTLSANLEPQSLAMQQLQARIAAIASIDKALELQLRRVDAQREAVLAEIDAVQKVIAKNISTTFKTFTQLSG